MMGTWTLGGEHEKESFSYLRVKDIDLKALKKIALLEKEYLDNSEGGEQVVIEGSKPHTDQPGQAPEEENKETEIGLPKGDNQHR